MIIYGNHGNNSMDVKVIVFLRIIDFFYYGNKKLTKK